LTDVLRIVASLALIVCTGFTMPMQQSVNPCRITSVRAEAMQDSIVLRIAGAPRLEQYQRPERTGRSVVFRIPNATHAAALDSTLTAAGLAIRHETIRDILVYRITIPAGIKDVAWRRDGPSTVVLSFIKEASASKEEPSRQAGSRKKWELDVIVLDAGHGGIDGGAEGTNGALEKNVTLAIAKKLRTLIREAMPDTRIVMTRDDDTFVELFRRTEIANEAGGKLFISIHCNSMPTKPHPAHGCETYILRPGRNADAARVAARENASIQFERSQQQYKGLSADQLIMATMAQRSFVQLSETLAAKIQREVSRRTPLQNRGVSQAGFYVLVGASMPNILFETAFLSNKNDAAYITSEKGQEQVAASMLEAIKAYARDYRELLK